LQLALVVRMCGALQYVKEDNKLCYWKYGGLS
jgi:hypothetical protein